MCCVDTTAAAVCACPQAAQRRANSYQHVGASRLPCSAYPGCINSCRYDPLVTLSGLLISKSTNTNSAVLTSAMYDAGQGSSVFRGGRSTAQQAVGARARAAFRGSQRHGPTQRIARACGSASWGARAELRRGRLGTDLYVTCAGTEPHVRHLYCTEPHRRSLLRRAAPRLVCTDPCQQGYAVLHRAACLCRRAVREGSSVRCRTGLAPSTHQAGC